MFKLIARIRSQPPEYRRKVAFFSAAVLTGLIIVVWFVSLFVGITRPIQEARAIDAAPGPFETFVGQIGAGFSSMGDAFKNFKK